VELIAASIQGSFSTRSLSPLSYIHVRVLCGKVGYFSMRMFTIIESGKHRKYLSAAKKKPVIVG